MHTATVPASLAAEQARTIRKALAAGRSLLAWSVSLADGRTLVLLASTDRAARSTAAVAAPVLKVGPAMVRDLQAAIDRALQAAPAPTAAAPRPVKAARPAPKDPAFEREWAQLLADEARENAARAERAYWLTGEGARPALHIPTVRPVAGTPKHEITVRPRPGAGAPFVGDGSKVRPGQGAKLAHEYTATAPAAPVWDPAASTLVVTGRPMFRA
jgi:hypothetical protein